MNNESTNIGLVSINDFITTMTMNTCDIRISTRKIAEHFDKKHQHILEAIDNAECSEKFSQSNFRQSEYTNSRGRTYREILVTEKGFNFIILAFSGKKAAQYREAYIEAFDALKKYYIKRQKKEINRNIKYNNEFITEATQAGLTRAQIERELKPKNQRDYQEILEDAIDQFEVYTDKKKWWSGY